MYTHEHIVYINSHRIDIGTLASKIVTHSTGYVCSSNRKSFSLKFVDFDTVRIHGDVLVLSNSICLWILNVDVNFSACWLAYV